MYRGPVVIDKPLTLIGQPGTLIEGDGKGSVVVIRGDRVTLKSIAMRGDGGELTQDDAAILIQNGHFVTIQDCTIHSRAFGIYLAQGGENQILRNRIWGDRTRRSSDRGNGIHLWKTERNRIVGNVVEGTRDGLYFSFAHSNFIAENRIRSVRYGVHYMYSERNRLARNRVVASHGGIALMFSRDNQILDNRAEGNRQFGFLLMQLENSLFLRNVASRNARGVFLENSRANAFRDNRIHSNRVGVYFGASSEEILFTENIFLHNELPVFGSRRGENQWSQKGRGNYWSHYVGWGFWGALGLLWLVRGKF